MHSDDDVHRDVRGDDSVHLSHLHAESALLCVRVWVADRRAPDDRLNGKQAPGAGPMPRTMYILTARQTSNTASPDPTPAVTVQACSTCETSVFKTSVPGFTPGARCYDCRPSGTDDPVASMTLENHELETVSLIGKGNSLSEVTADGASDPLAASAPSENTPSLPASASATYLTAGASRNSVHAGLIGLIVGLILVT